MLFCGKKTRAIIGAIISFILVLTPAFSGCSAAQKNGSTFFNAFKNTPVSVFARGIEIDENLKTELQNLAYDLNSEFSSTVNTSAVYKINQAKSGEKTVVSDRFIDIFNECAYMSALTKGKFDPSVYPLTLLWQFAPDFPVEEFNLPKEEDILSALNLVGINGFTVDGAIIKENDDAKLDFGGALKGYFADMGAKIIKKAGASGGFINVGDSSLYIIYADTLSVTHPRKDGYILKITSGLKDVSVSTSGDYEKYYEYNDERFSHIIDPANGYPSKTFAASATVITKNGLKADALSTALCLFSHDFTAPQNGELYRFIKEVLSISDFADAKIYVVTDDGINKQILTNEKQGENFTLQDKDYSIVYIE